jgi:hypothetical protein
VPLPRLYVVRNDMHGPWGTEYVPADPARYGEAPTCRACGAFTGGRRWLDPLRVALTVHGQGPADFAFFGGGEFLVTAAALEAFDLGAVRPVEVTECRGWPLADLPRYFYPELRVGPAVDLERTVIVTDSASPCAWCGPNAADAIGAIHVDESTWEDLDWFVPRRLPGVVLVTQHVVDAVERAGLTGIAFVGAEQHRWDPLNLLAL